MREILFRGKRVDNGEWIYGYYVHQYGADMIYLPDGTDREYGFDYYHIIPETVGQYTGLTDKNSKKIFEGDIVNIEYPETTVKNTVIEYIGTGFYGGDEGDAWELDNYYSLEVIGNIHDNPELLKGENDA